MTSPRSGSPSGMIFFSMIGRRMPYANLLTRMKSPTSSVGRIDELGILNGSAMNERSRNTISSTGKKLFGYSIHHGSGSPAGRFRAITSRSASAISPVTTVSKNSSRAKFMGRCVSLVVERYRPGARVWPHAGSDVPTSARQGTAALSAAPRGWRRPSFVTHLQYGQERLLRNFDASHRFHTLLACLLLFEQLFLARDVAAVAFGKYVLAHRLDRFAGDDLRADGRLDRHVEHLPRDQRTHLRHHLAAAVLRNRAMDHHRQRVDALAVDQDVELDHVGCAELLEFVIERRIAS